MKNKKLLLGGLLVLGVGFAAVTTTLTINGRVNITADDAGFKQNVKFKTVKLGETDISASAIAADGKSFEFTAPALDTIGETATVTYTIENKSQYGAVMPALVCTPTDTLANTYLTVTGGAALEGTTIAKNTVSGEDTITITMKQSYAGTAAGTSTPESPEEKQFTYNCKLENITAAETN